MNKYIVSVEKRDTKGNYTANKRVSVETNSESEARKEAMARVSGAVKVTKINKISK